LTHRAQIGILPRVIRPRRRRNSCENIPVCLAAAACFALAVTAHAASFSQARVTRIQNKVNYGVVKAGRSITRPAAVADLVRENNYLLSETESRAELQYEDGSVVRIGQNTVFSFDADTRKLTLEKGSLIFYIPKGSGGGLIKTPSLTAAITGTVGKVSVDTIAILNGQAKLVPSGRTIEAGSFARRNADGSISIRPMDMSRAGEGELMRFNGPMPGYEPPESAGSGLTLDFSQLNLLRTMEFGTNLPSSNAHYFPVIRERTNVKVPPRVERPSGNGDGNVYPVGGGKGT
jgi:FecR-like protein